MNDTESTLIQIVENVVGVQSVKREARFLDIGGNSLNLVQVLKEIREKLGVELPPRIFFDKSKSTIVSLSAEVNARRKRSDTTAEVPA